MPRRSVASGSLVVLSIGAVFVGLGVLALVAVWGDSLAVAAILSFVGLGLLAMVHGARASARHERDSQPR
ncbi:hypothetical protein [Nostocoides sp.]|uniref:hypothetical protein n=1 Tax=Nostocoides sp. TaxID=1917966 RepID=UPI002CAA9552|nr:hypothetical protein [Tetrasphaera sp.]